MRFVFRAFRAFRGLRFNLVDTVAYNREEDSLQIPDRELDLIVVVVQAGMPASLPERRTWKICGDTSGTVPL